MDIIGNANINHGKGSTLTNMIKYVGDNNIPLTHFLVLNLRFYKGVRAGLKDKVRQEIFTKINNIDYTAIFMTQLVCTINWKSNNKTTSSFYYTVSPLDEQFVRKTTKKMLIEIVNNINNNGIGIRSRSGTDQNIEYINDQQWNLSFLVGKNATFSTEDIERQLEEGNFTNFDLIEYNNPTTPLVIDY